MALKTNSEGRKLYNVVKAVAGVPITPLQVLNRDRTWPNAIDDSPIAGDDGTTKYLAIDQTTAPDFDSRLFRQVITEGPDGNLWRIHRGVEPLTKQEKIAHVENREGLERSKILPQTELSAVLVTALAAVLRTAKNLPLNEKEREAAEKLVAISAAIQKNQANRDEKIAAITANMDPALDEGWEQNP